MKDDSNAGSSFSADEIDLWDYGFFSGVILLDLDETLVRTNLIESLRSEGRWSEVMRSFSQTSLPQKTRMFLETATQGAVGVVTSSPRAYAEALLRHHGLKFPVVVAYHDTDRHKPFPDPILKAAQWFGVAPEVCLYIGDQVEDILAADAAGAASIGINWERTDVFGHIGERVMKRGRVRVCTDWDDVIRFLTTDWYRSVEEALEADSEMKARMEELETIGPEARQVNPASVNDVNRLEAHLDLTWRGHDFTIFKYTPWGRGATPANELILDYKNNKLAAVNKVNQYAIRAVEEQESKLRPEKYPRYIVGVPSHHPGPCGPHLRSTCKALLDRFDWLQDGTDWLVRTTDVPSSARSGPGERPTQKTHVETMQLDKRKIEREIRLDKVVNIPARLYEYEYPSMVQKYAHRKYDDELSKDFRKTLKEWFPDDWKEELEKVEEFRRAVKGTRDAHNVFKQRPEVKKAQELLKGFKEAAQAIYYRDALAAAYEYSSIIMIDDVITKGSTSGAARQILDDFGFDSVVGLFVARTVRTG